jgi:superfamily II helicase
MKEDLLKGLSKEQIARIRDCKNSDEILALAKEEGIALTDEQLEVISGGGAMCSNVIRSCAVCYSSNYVKIENPKEKPDMKYMFVCKNCGHIWYSNS